VPTGQGTPNGVSLYSSPKKEKGPGSNKFWAVGKKKLNGKESLRHAQKEQMFSAFLRWSQAKFSIQQKRGTRSEK